MIKGIPKGIGENLRFLIVEVESQLGLLQDFFLTPSDQVARRILDRSGYAYNLKMRIHDSCLNTTRHGRDPTTSALVLRAMESIATDLERITELCRDTIHQMKYFRCVDCLEQDAYPPMLEQIIQGIGLIEHALVESDTRQALKIGRIEQKIDQAYEKLRKRYTRRLKRRDQNDTEDLISALFVAHSVEQMGDALLNVSEAIISINLGQPVNIDRYHAIKESVEQLGSANNLANLVVKPIAETRSGSAISGISPADSEADYVAIYKDGKKRKLREEREGVESWHEIFPGLAPRILSYKKRGQSASLLIEHLAGLTFEQILLHEPVSLLQETLDALKKTLKSIWKETRTGEPVSAEFMRQLEGRLDSVYAIHPEFAQTDSTICSLTIPSFDTLIRRCRDYEAAIHAPFSVYIHGDFNVDNIIYDPLEKKINFIDLHRSRYMDYVQDISVFMVSIYRLQVLDTRLREQMLAQSCEFYRFARGFAQKAGDESFNLRLALGLARSFATSTRFILDKSLANAMFVRARYLMEKVLEVKPAQAAKFQLPVKEIFVV